MFSKPLMRWYEPRWAYVDRMWAQLRHILNAASLSRIVIATAIISLLIVACIKWAMPQFVIPNLWPFLFAFPAILMMLVAQFAILTLIPPSITIRAEKIIIQHGQTARIIDQNSIRKISLAIHSQDRVRLRISYRKKGITRSRCIGVAGSVDLYQLCEHLPIFPTIRDARKYSSARLKRWHFGIRENRNRLLPTYDLTTQE